MTRAILASAVLWLAATAAGYDNVKVHPLFNSLALQRAVEKLQTAPSRPEFAAYDFTPGQVGWATWTMALKPVPETRLESEPSPLDDKPRTFAQWVALGGLTADLNYGENFEIALRHFYDPVAANPPGAGVPWLTDLIEEDVTIWKLGEANPHTTAEEWALGNTGDPNRESRHSLKRYQEALNAYLLTGEKSQAALAWLCLGETLHLLADMTVPAHVRNDGHPGTPGTYKDIMEHWRSDPYENDVDDVMIGQLQNGAADPAPLTALSKATTPGDIFDIVARYTNANFVSQDTISGTGPDGAVLTNRNGLAAYPSPKVKFTGVDSVLFKTTDYMGDLLQAEVTWTFVNKTFTTDGPLPGWGANTDLPPRRLEVHRPSAQDPGNRWRILAFTVTHRCVVSQASRLVPLTIAAESRLIEMIMPQLKVTLATVEANNNRVTGTATALRNAVTPRRLNLYFLVDGRLSEREVQVLTRPDGSFEAVIPPAVLSARPADGKPYTLALAMDLGGILVKSNAVEVSPAGPASVLEVAGPDVLTEGQVASFHLRLPPDMAARVAKVRWLTSMEAVSKFNEKDMAAVIPFRTEPTVGQLDFAAAGDAVPYQGITNTPFLYNYRSSKPARSAVIAAVGLDSSGAIVGRARKNVTLRVCPIDVPALKRLSGWKVTASDNALSLVKEVQVRPVPPAGNDFASASFASAAGSASVKAGVTSDYLLLPSPQPWTAADQCKGLFRYVYDYGSLVPSSTSLDQNGWKGTLAEFHTSDLPRRNGRFSGLTYAGYAHLDLGLIRRRVSYYINIDGAKFSHTSGAIDDTGALSATAATLQKEAVEIIQTMTVQP